MKTVIIDNDAPVVEALEKMIQCYCPSVEIIATANSVESGYALLRSLKKVDLIFLDVELDDGTGMDLLQKLDERDFQVVFITAHEKYAVDAFRFSAVEFLLKPFDPDDLMLAIKKTKDRVKANFNELQLTVLAENMRNSYPRIHKIVIKNQDSIHIIPVQEILFFEADGGYTKIYARGKQILSSRHLKHYESLVRQLGFFRVHHSYLVNLHQITRFDRTESILIVDVYQVKVSYRRRDLLLFQLDQLNDLET